MIRENKNIRLENHDYSKPGLYFITICTQKKENYLGDVINDKIEYSVIGDIAFKCWLEIPIHFQNVRLHEIVIMPNHIHGILEITGNVNSRHVVNPQKFGPLLPGSIPVIVGQFKAAVTRWCNKNKHKYFGWQRRYHDHIIRNQEEFYKIANYIRNNPANWNGYKFYR